MRVVQRFARSWGLGVLVVALVIVVHGGRSHAQSVDAADAPDDALARAKDLNRQGVAVLDAGDTERALDYFRRSRAAYPSGKNVANIAICLDRLGRYDEALELYEELLTKYAADLDADDRSIIAPAMAKLRGKVGSLDVRANVDASIQVDGRARGEVPLSAPLRVVAGVRRVRIVKEGYRTFETDVDVPAAGTRIVDADLKAVPGMGRIRVEVAAAPDAAVTIDGVRVGTAPWEGVLAAGPHVLWTRGARLGSTPESVVVLEGQVALVRPSARPLGRKVSVTAEPATARVTLGTVALASGAGWDDPLPVGSYVATATEPGYQTATRRFEVTPEGEPLVIVLRLAVDPEHPRWPKKPVAPGRSTFSIEAFGGVAAAATLGSGAEEACPASCGGEDPTAIGAALGVRATYRLPIGLGADVSAGYLTLTAAFERRLSSSFSHAGTNYSVAYAIAERPSFSGPFVTVGPSFRLPLGKRFGARARFSAGVLAAESRDPIEGTAQTTGSSSSIETKGSDTTVRSLAFLVVPELGLDVTLGPFQVALGVGLAILPSNGPSFDHHDLRPKPAMDAISPGSVGNASATDAIAGERAYGGFVAWMPTLSLGRTF